MNPEPDEQDLATFHQYLGIAGDFCDRMIDAATREDGPVGADIAMQLHNHPDPSLLMVVLGQFAVRVLNAKKPNGPMATAEELGYQPPPSEPWHTAIHDQVIAAAADKDFETVGRLIVDGQLSAMRIDMEHGEATNFDSLIKAMMLVDHGTLVIVAAEALRRLAGHNYKEDA